MTEQEKIDDFKNRANDAKAEIDKILRKFELTIAPIWQYLPQGITSSCELLNLKKFPEEPTGEEKAKAEEAMFVNKKK
jgi:hypothetical protein